MLMFVPHAATCIKGQLDVLFIIDSSSNVGSDNFDSELRTAANLAENFKIGPDAVQFGAITFADSPSNLFDFNTYDAFLDIEKVSIIYYLLYTPASFFSILLIFSFICILSGGTVLIFSSCCLLRCYYLKCI
jgi:hypothetical protein